VLLWSVLIPECATCHVYLAPRPSEAPVPEPSEDELDMLDFALDYRDGLSRLGCQIEVTPELAKWCAEGGVIDLPRF
jgi:ferredoxin